MFTISRVSVAVLAALTAAVLAAAPASAAPAVAGEFPIPDGVGSNNDIVQGPDGNMWVTREGAVNNGVARITPDGVVTAFDLPNTSFGIESGPDGNLWVSTAIGVIKVPPANPAGFTAYDVGLASGGHGIVTGPDGRLWVAGTGELVSFNSADPEGTDVSTPITGLDPKGMSVGSDGLLWIADNGGRVISATAGLAPVVTSYDIRIAGAGGAQDVAGGPGGQVAYAAPTTDPQTVGRITPGGSPLKTELTASDPFGVVFAPDGAYWVARSATNDLLRLTPDGQTTTLTGFAPSGGVGPRKIATGPGNTLWVTLDTPDKVAKITGVEPPAPPTTEPDTALEGTPKKKLKAKDKKNGKKGKTKAKFEFSTTTAGAGFECSLQPKGKQSKFKPCSSPAKYKLKPGRYVFAVRAVLAGVPDPSAETFGFKVKRQKR